MAGKAGRYISIASGAKAISAPRIRMKRRCPRLMREGSISVLLHGNGKLQNRRGLIDIRESASGRHCERQRSNPEAANAEGLDCVGISALAMTIKKPVPRPSYVRQEARPAGKESVTTFKHRC